MSLEQAHKPTLDIVTILQASHLKTGPHIAADGYYIGVGTRDARRGQSKRRVDLQRWQACAAPLQTQVSLLLVTSRQRQGSQSLVTNWGYSAHVEDVRRYVCLLQL